MQLWNGWLRLVPQKMVQPQELSVEGFPVRANKHVVLYLFSTKIVIGGLIGKNHLDGHLEEESGRKSLKKSRSTHSPLGVHGLGIRMGYNSSSDL